MIGPRACALCNEIRSPSESANRWSTQPLAPAYARLCSTSKLHRVVAVRLGNTASTSIRASVPYCRYTSRVYINKVLGPGLSGWLA